MRCIRCMNEIDDGALVCSFCNSPQDLPPDPPDSLSAGTELRNRFILGAALGRGGFGITYVGYDKYLDCKVAIKEYYPKSFAARLPGTTNPNWESIEARDSGCQAVIREAQKMHRLGILPAAVHVLDVFYENDTVYIAMDYVEGVTLKQYLLKNGILSPKKCIELMLPIIDTMIQMHEAGIIHRDISPDNIMLQSDLKPRILDLGAAKDIQWESGYTSLVAKSGFSPIEQYQTTGKIDTWTDVYALCATMYYSLIGRVPPPALDRINGNDTLPFKPDRDLPKALQKVLEDGMRVQPQDRIHNMTELKKRLENSLLPEYPPAQEPVQTPVSPAPPIAHYGSTYESDGATHEDKPSGIFPALFSILGKKKKHHASGAAKAERKPVGILIPTLDAYPIYSDPNATVCQDSYDDESTVLEDDQPPVPANAVLVHDRTGKRFEVTKCCFILGRLTTGTAAGTQLSADCMIENSTKHMSRRHAAILFDGESFYLHDISVKNTTLLNNIRIQNAVMPEKGGTFPAAYRLCNGDRIQLADEALTFHTGGSL